MSRRFAVVSEQGRRDEMEDAHYLNLNLGNNSGWVFGGVYDGHCGKKAAEYCSQHLHERFLQCLNKGFSAEEAFEKSYVVVSDELQNQNSGACTANFFLMDDEIYAANVGDARILVVGRKEVVQLTVDHRLNNIQEKERIDAWGGNIKYPYVYKGSQGLMPTRTIGDQYFKPVGIIAEPHTSVYRLSDQDLAVVAACDGLFDEMTNEEVAEIVRKSKNARVIAESLRKETLEVRRGSDNLTIIVYLLK